MPKWQLTLLFALCAGQFVRNIISTVPGRDPVTSDAKTLIGSRPLPKRENTAMATKTRLPSTDAARLSRGRRERLRVRRRHHGAQHPGRQVKTACSRTPTETLVGRLGPAFNARYMSISKPHRELSSVSASLGESPAASAQHRTQVDQSDAVDASSHGEFRVDQDFSRIVRVKPTWQTTRESAEALRDRTKRATRPRKKPASSRKRPVREQWECAQKIVWRDLGADYFPRYLRSVACTQSTCWFGAFECRPRAFTVKVRYHFTNEVAFPQATPRRNDIPEKGQLSCVCHYITVYITIILCTSL
ncbi:hypothetical protein LSAT2_000760, partial [Lamellibrachia satsuma]